MHTHSRAGRQNGFQRCRVIKKRFGTPQVLRVQKHLAVEGRPAMISDIFGNGSVDCGCVSCKLDVFKSSHLSDGGPQHSSF